MPSHDSHRRARRTHFPRLPLVYLLWMFSVGAPLWAQQSLPAPILSSPQTSSVPGWQSGKSNWNGSSYETLPPPPAVTPTSPSPTLAQPELPARWNENFGLSEAPVYASVIEELPLEDAVGVPSEIELTDPSGVSAGEDADREPESFSDLPIGAALAEAADLEEPPLEEEIVQWYEIPWRWISKGWTSHAELGLNGSSGNAVTSAIQTGLEMNRKTDIYTLGIDFNYRQASNQKRNTENNARLNIDYDRLLGKSKWTSFGKIGFEYDKFKAFDLRLNMNAGFGYYWLRNDKVNLITRTGLGASREFGAPMDEWTPEAVLGLSYDHQLSERQKVIGKLDYFPSLRKAGDFRVVTDLAWETLIDTAENLSLRLSVTDRYDSTPQGALPNDVYYAALLLYKF